MIPPLTSRTVYPGLLPTRVQAAHGIYWSCTLFELLLLGKAVVAAVLADDQLMPPRPDAPGGAAGHSGLLCMYGSIVAALLCSFVEGWLGRRLVARWRKQCEALDGYTAAGSSSRASSSVHGSSGSSAAQPLLGKASAADEASACGGGPGRLCRPARLAWCSLLAPKWLLLPPLYTRLLAPYLLAV